MGYYKPASIHCKFLPGLTADSKMSASEENTTIYTTDDEATVKKKINKYAFSGGQPTIEEHRKKGGNPEIDIPYQWLSYLEEDDGKLKQIHDDYKSGKMLTGEIKQIAIDKINSFLKEHQRKRELARKQLDRFILRD